MREYPYWKAFTRRVKSIEWVGPIVAFIALGLILAVLLYGGDRPPVEQRLLP